MYKTLPFIFAAGALAQSTITTSWIAGAFDNVPVASVVAADADAVTYSISCNAEDIANDECGIPAQFTVTAGASTFEYHFTESDDTTGGLTVDVGCQLLGTTQAVCAEAFVATAAGVSSDSTETLTGSDLEWGPLVITAGIEKLSATAGATATHQSASASETTTSSAQSGSRSSAAAASATGSSTPSGSATHPSATGGAAQLAVPVAGVAGILVAAIAL